MGVHVGLVKLFRYLKTRYFGRLDISDDGDYWETSDLKTLRERQAFLNQKLAQVQEALTGLPAVEDSASLVDRIEECLRRLVERNARQ